MHGTEKRKKRKRVNNHSIIPKKKNRNIIPKFKVHPKLDTFGIW